MKQLVLSFQKKAKNLDFLLNKFNLESSTAVTFSELDQNKNSETDTHFPNELIKKVFDMLTV